MALTLQCCFCLAICLGLGFWASQVEARTLDEMAMVNKHEQWMVQYGRVYKDVKEKEKRFLVFKNNVERIESFNQAGNKSYKLSINGFADLDNEEFKAVHTGYMMKSTGNKRSSSSNTVFMYHNVTDVPTSLDWRSEGAVTPIKNQGGCGCCWAFSAVAAMEGITKLKTGNLVSLSEQELVDCDINNSGCQGGIMDKAFQFIQQNQGLTTESNYPYEEIDGTCHEEKAAYPAAKITGYEDVPANNEQALLQAVANQPVSVAIEGSGSSFQFYSSGLFTGECSTNLDHAVTVIGYGENNDGTKYWLLKNSWGTGWGENGYMKIQRDVAEKEGLCGLAMKASYPTI
ncbi:senescence-specific cysteine protease SAG12-like [Telopea speciosissima]|uniref:senescence-specific cysteine protease SAG12-like n=1 Tax=Telopea speciosissima TaxID=54955 RepID=UPI001CC3CF4F|nr:senescence-specific cysteine protease SAG12-like [Telopea speciosissima]